MNPYLLTRLASRACRIAFRNIGGMDFAYKEEVARRIQEVWEEEGVDISSLATQDPFDDADRMMRQVYRARKELPSEVRCDWCGEMEETSKAIVEAEPLSEGASVAKFLKFCSYKHREEYAESIDRRVREGQSLMGWVPLPPRPKTNA